MSYMFRFDGDKGNGEEQSVSALTPQRTVFPEEVRIRKSEAQTAFKPSMTPDVRNLHDCYWTHGCHSMHRSKFGQMAACNERL